MSAIATEDIQTTNRRLELVMISRLRKNQISKKAVEIQNKIREKAGDWQASELIRKWREKR